VSAKSLDNRTNRIEQSNPKCSSTYGAARAVEQAAGGVARTLARHKVNAHHHWVDVVHPPPSSTLLIGGVVVWLW
jgi:hypothetical protein